MAQIGDDGLADVGGQRQPLPASPLAAHHHLAVVPVDILQREGGHLTGSQPEACQQREDGEVPHPGDRVPVAAVEQRRHRVGAQRPGQRLIRPAGGGGHGLRQRTGGVALQEQKAQQRPQRGDQHLGRAPAASATLADHERGHVAGRQVLQVEPVSSLTLRHEQSSRAQVALDAAGRQPAFVRQVGAVLLHQNLRRRRGGRLRGDGRRSQAPQVAQQRRQPLPGQQGCAALSPPGAEELLHLRRPQIAGPRARLSSQRLRSASRQTCFMALAVV